MRNLKKVLSLVLALAMMLSMMAFASAAEKKTITSADLTDMDQVNNKAAVSLLVDLGVLNGIEQADGTYKYEPAMGINRASWAKMIYYVMTGEADASAYKGLDLGLKDVAGHWAEGEIAYCVANKIASGDLEKNFLPDADITVVAAAKMLLTALGYDATLSKYENDQLWSLNIMNDAKKAGLMVGVAQAANEVLTRDNAAQMAYNALNAITVQPVVQYDMGVAYLSGYNPDTVGSLTLGQQIYGLAKVTGVVTELEAGKAVVTLSANPYGITQAVLKSFAGSADLLGQTVSFFIQAAQTDADASLDYVKTWSSALIADGSSLLATSANGTALDTLTKKTTPAHPAFVAELEQAPATVLYFVNGDSKTKTDVDSASVKKGAVIELYDTDSNGKVDVVKATVKTVGYISAPAKETTTAAGTLVTVYGLPGLNNVSAETVVGYKDLAAGDVVLYYTVDGIIYIEKAEVVTGVATGKNSDDDILVNGTYLDESQLAGETADLAKFDNYRTEYNFYLDNGGQVVAHVSTTQEPPAAYLYVLDAEYVSGQGVGATKYMEAQVLFADGTTEIITVGSAMPAGKTDPKDAIVLGDSTEKNLEFSFWSYREDPQSGAYSLTGVTATPIADKTRVEGKVDFAKLGTTIANAKTVFLVEINDGRGPATYTVYTGYANLPTMDLTAAGSALAEDGVATLVYLKAAGFVGQTNKQDNVYLLDPDTFTYVVENGDVVALSTKAVYAGEVIDLLVDSKEEAALRALSAGLYNITGVGESGIVSTANMTLVGGSNVAGDKLFMANGVVKNHSGAAYSYNADTVLYYIDTALGTVTEMAVDAFVADENAVYNIYVLNNAPVNVNHAKEIYIIK